MDRLWGAGGGEAGRKGWVSGRRRAPQAEGTADACGMRPGGLPGAARKSIESGLGEECEEGEGSGER